MVPPAYYAHLCAFRARLYARDMDSFSDVASVASGSSEQEWNEQRMNDALIPFKQNFARDFPMFFV